MTKYFITLNTAVFNFQAGQEYEAIKLEDGTFAVLVTAAIGKAKAQLSVPSQVIEKIREEIEVGPHTVATNLTEAEKTALSQFKKKQEKLIFEGDPLTGGLVKAKTKSVVQQMLEDEMSFPGEEPTLADIAVEQQAVLDAELLEKRAKLVPHLTPLLEECQCWLTDLTGGTMPTSGIDHIITCFREDAFPENVRPDIPEFDMFHEWEPDVLESIFLSHTMNVKNLLVGYPGSGKSTSIQQYAALIRHPFMKINGKSGIDGSSFIGFLWANGGGTQFAEGMLPIAMRNGYIMAIDEVFKIPPEVQMNFQTVYEEGGCLVMDEKPGVLADKIVYPHKWFRLMATDNAYGTGDNFEKFGATQVQDSSTLDRFGLTVHVPYMPQAKEIAVLKRMYPKVKEEAFANLVKVAGLVREAYQQSNLSITLSMRGLKVMARLLLAGVSEVSAFHMGYLSKVADDAEVGTIRSFINTVGLSNNPGEAKEPEPEPPPPVEMPQPLTPEAKKIKRASPTKGIDKPLPWE